MADHMDADMGAVVTLDPITRRPTGAFFKGFPAERMPAGAKVNGRGVLGRVISGSTLFADDVRKEMDLVFMDI